MERRRYQDIQIRLEGIGYRIKDKWLFRDVNLTFEDSESYLLLGRNGSGKTTLLKILAGIEMPSEGRIYLNGKIVHERDELLSVSGYVFQNPQTQVIGSTVEEDVAFGLENLNIERDEMIKRVENILKRIGLWEVREYDPSLLSGGQLQRLAIASVMALDPHILLLDEPLSMLDPQGSEEVLEMIRSVAKDKTVVVATHEPERYPFVREKLVIKDKRIFKIDDFSKIIL